MKGEIMTVDETELTNQDRCDRCGSQAYVKVIFNSGADLMLCGHHWNTNKDYILKLENTLIQDELEKLTAQS